MKKISVLLLAITFFGCGHLNHLSNYPMKNTTFMFRSFTSGNAQNASVTVVSPTADPLAEIVASIGSAAMSNEGRKKLDNAINGELLAGAVGKGIRQVTLDYLAAHEVSDNSTFIVETELTKYQITSSPVGLAVRVCAVSRIFDRASAEKIWENDEEQTVRLTSTGYSAAGGKPTMAGASIINAAQLFRMEESDIRRVVSEAAEEAGRKMGETLRKDVRGL